MQRRHGEFLWLPKGAPHRMCGRVPSFDKDAPLSAGRALPHILCSTLKRSKPTGQDTE